MANLNLSFQSLEPFFKKIEGLEKLHRLIICLVTLFAIIALFGFFPIRNAHTQIDAKQSQLSQVNNKLAAAQKKAATLERLQKEWKMREAEFRSVMKALPEKKEIAGLLTSISQSGQDTGLEFSSLQPQPLRDKGFYKEIPVNMTVKGDFHNLVMFFDEVSRLNRIVNIRNMKVSRGSDVLEATYEVVTYQFDEKDSTKQDGNKKK